MAIKIPTIQAETALPVTRVFSRNVLRPVPGPAPDTSGPGRALTGLGSQLGESARQIFQQEEEIQRKKKAIEHTNFLSDLQVDIAGENEKIQEEERKNPDPTNYFSNWQRQFREVAQARVDAIQDPELKARANNMVRGFEARELVQQKHYGNVLWLDTQKARVTRNLKEFARRGDRKSGISLIEQNTLKGVFTDTEAGALEKEFSADVEHAGIIGAIHSEDPLSANPRIDAAEHISETQRATYRAAAKEKAETVQKKREQEEEKLIRDGAYRTLKSDWGTDYDVMFVQLSDPHNWDYLGIKTVDQKRKVEEDLENERRTFEIQRNTAHDANFRPLFGRKDINPSQIDEMVRGDRISPEQGHFLKTDLQKVETVKTDNNYWAQMFDSILAGKDMRSEILWGGNNRRLSDADTKHLYALQGNRETQREQHFTSDPWFRLSDQKFREALGAPEMQLTPAEAIQKRLTGEMGARASQRHVKDDRYYSAVTDLMRAIETGEAEKKPIRGESIWMKAQEILKVYAVQKPPPDIMSEMPDPKKNTGRVVTDPTTGERWKSNGKEWIPIRPGT